MPDVPKPLDRAEAISARWFLPLEIPAWALIGVAAIADESLMMRVLVDFWEGRIGLLLH